MREPKFYVQTLLNSYFHLDRDIDFWFDSLVVNDELLFFGDAIVIAVDDDVDVIAQPNNYTIVRFKLLFDSVEGKVICHVVSQCSRRF